MATTPELHRRCQQCLQPTGQQMPAAEKHPDHFRHQRHSEHCRNQKFAAFAPPRAFSPFTFLAALPAFDYVSLKAPLLNRAHHLLRANQAWAIAHTGSAAGKQYRSMHIGQSFKCRLNAIGAAFAAHAGEFQRQILFNDVKTDFMYHILHRAAFPLQPDARTLAGEIGVGFHPRQAVQHALKTHSTGRAGHAANAQDMPLIGRCNERGSLPLVISLLSLDFPLKCFDVCLVGEGITYP